MERNSCGALLENYCG